jgi:hypothetical protein
LKEFQRVSHIQALGVPFSRCSPFDLVDRRESRANVRRYPTPVTFLSKSR